MSHVTRAFVTAAATFQREWTVNVRAYTWTFFTSGLMAGILTVAVAYFSYHAIGAGKISHSFTDYAGTSSYISYVALGMIGFMLVESMMLAISRALIQEHRQGTMVSLCLSPSRRLDYLIGVGAQATLTSFAQVAVLLLALLPFGLTLRRASAAELALALPLLLFASFAMSLILGAIMLGTSDTYISQNTLFLLIAVLCGFTFPPQYLPAPLLYVSGLIPLTPAMELFRSALLPTRNQAGLAVHHILTCALLAAAVAIAGAVSIRYAERKVLEGIS